MVTGQRPFGGTAWHLINQHFNEQPASLRGLRPDAPPELESLVTQLLAKARAERPARADDVTATRYEIDKRYFGNHPPRRGQDITSEVLDQPGRGDRRSGHSTARDARKTCPACASRPGGTGSARCDPYEGSGQTCAHIVSGSPPDSGTGSESA
ncbi:hypothetical protein OIE62_39820 [Streptomyces scopuliridis]|uniref:Uncharacterized protein n=1 Tax=Streptomyces scopuliridis TaxID=452529 RepID=A0ACD4ZC80_9ACTN|nr:hypothetical protein [Streptomyces scopuliridis]WSB95758.1 hypothetical protein OG835_01105 [Streptomyces scopuliridis]WSC10535.1 hypothetical protein OIE62_39820 [Streptomyces scopuliridis]